MSWYQSMPQNSLTRNDVTQIVLGVLNSTSAYGSYVPRGIPQISVDLPIVTNLPKGAENGTEVYLRVGDGNQIAHMLYLASIPGWVQTGLPPIVTALPTSVAVQGMEVIYDAGDGIRWHLMYDTSDGTTYPWMFIGGPSLYAETATSSTRATNTFGNLAATTGPDVTLPLAGDYDVSIGCNAWNNTTAQGFYMSYDIGATGAVTADALFMQENSGGNTAPKNASRTRRKTGLTAVTLASKYRSDGGSTATFQDRWISATPVRVG